MRMRLAFWWTLASLSAWLTQAVNAADSRPVNLLKPPTASVEQDGTVAADPQHWQTLTDGDPSTTATAAASEESPLTIVYGFHGEIVSPERLVVTLPRNDAAASAPVRVELLVSTLSPHAGFQTVRSDPLGPTTKPQEFRFNAIGARWVMLRFTPAPKSKHVAVSEVELIGQPGPPATRYAFKEAPARALEVLERLKGISSLDLSISADEASLFADAKDGKFDTWSFAEAALLVSNVQGKEERQRYLKTLEKIEAEARKAVSAARNPFDRGAALLRFLHSGPLSQGYVSQQTDLSQVLAKRTFNCVSSATLYNVIGRRLKLDLRAVEVPNHAFSILYDGTKHADVETTTAAGFNPARDADARQEFTRLTGFAYIPDSNRDERREVGEVGLVAIICYNHGVEFMQDKRYHEALLAFFRAMSLDPEFDSAVKNALAVLANWSAELAQAKKFEEAVKVVATGLELAPQDATLVHNHEAVWSQWAEALTADGKVDEALAVLRRAAQENPKERFLDMQAWVFIRKGEELAKNGEWDKAKAVVEPGLKKLEGGPRDELVRWSENLPHRRAVSELERHNYEAALGVLAEAFSSKPTDSRLREHAAYVVQEWAGDVYRRDGAERAEAVIADCLRRFPQCSDVTEVARNHEGRVVKDLTSKAKYPEALAVADRAGQLLGDQSASLELARSVYDNWARDQTEKKDWRAAVDIYGRALKRWPKDDHLENNLVATWHAWAKSFAEQKDWSAASDVYAKALKELRDGSSVEQNICYFTQEWAREVYADKGADASVQVLKDQRTRFPAVKDLPDVAAGHLQRVARDLSAKGKFEEAVAVVDTAAQLLKDEDSSTDIAGAVYDTWARTFLAKDDFEQAVGVYRQGIKKFPKNRHLQQNAAATWDKWAKNHMEKKDWSGAIKVYEKSREMLPDDSVLKNNLEYCQEQLRKAKE